MPSNGEIIERNINEFQKIQAHMMIAKELKLEYQHIDTRHEQSLIYALDVLKREMYKKYLVSVYLYGSCARGDQKFQSDVDIFLFVDDNMPKHLIRKLRSEVVPDTDDMPEVDVSISKCTAPTSSKQFNENFERESILLWSRR